MEESVARGRVDRAGEGGLKGTSGEGGLECIGILRSAQDDGNGLRAGFHGGNGFMAEFHAAAAWGRSSVV
jgi:hypothetical protein